MGWGRCSARLQGGQARSGAALFLSTLVYAVGSVDQLNCFLFIPLVRRSAYDEGCRHVVRAAGVGKSTEKPIRDSFVEQALVIAAALPRMLALGLVRI